MRLFLILPLIFSQTLRPPSHPSVHRPIRLSLGCFLARSWCFCCDQRAGLTCASVTSPPPSVTWPPPSASGLHPPLPPSFVAAEATVRFAGRSSRSALVRSSRKTPLFCFRSFKFEHFCYFKHCSNSALCCSFASPVFNTFTLLILQIVAYYIKQVVISTLTPQMLAQREFRPGLDSETTNVPVCRWNPSSFCSFFIMFFFCRFFRSSLVLRPLGAACPVRASTDDPGRYERP